MKQGAHLTKPGWSKPHTHSNPTNLALFRHKITLYRFNQGGSYYCRWGSNESRGAEPPSPPHFNHCAHDRLCCRLFSLTTFATTSINTPTAVQVSTTGKKLRKVSTLQEIFLFKDDKFTDVLQRRIENEIRQFVAVTILFRRMVAHVAHDRCTVLSKLAPSFYQRLCHQAV